jgi:FlaA1/EpsC-like NDP-sugar epimerase
MPLARQAKRVAALLVMYSLAMAASFWLAYQLRFDFHVPAELEATFLEMLLAVVAIKLASLWAFKQFDSLLSYFGLADAQRMMLAMMSADLVMLFVRLAKGVGVGPPRSIILTDFLFSFFGLCLIRVGLRRYREHYGSAAMRTAKAKDTHRRLALYGAGDDGAALIHELSTKPGIGLNVVAVFDDDSDKWGTQLHGVPVLGGFEKLSQKHRELELDEVVIAMPSASGKRLREIVSAANHLHLRCEIVPSITQLVTGQVRASQIRPVELSDLLGRQPVDLETVKIRELVEDRTVMVTGAGGTIGSELCRQIAAYKPKRLLLVERCEIQLFQVEQELLAIGLGSEIVPLVADIQNAERMRMLFGRFRPQLVFHAAAHKHVPMMEHQPIEALQNNTSGTRKMADIAVEFGVECFVFISTDKAINPTNVMGASKRLAEMYLQSLQRSSGQKTRLIAVRFGNVLGSSGSVILTFKKQIASGGPVTVTHPDIMRYFMTVHEAVGLVLQSAAQGKNGGIFVLDMGQPVRIVDLAKQMIELSGLVPDVDVEIKYVGLRPGEKLFEEINHGTESLEPTSHPKILRFLGEARPLDRIGNDLRDLQLRVDGMEPNQVKLEIQRLVPEYKPYLGDS